MDLPGLDHQLGDDIDALRDEPLHLGNRRSLHLLHDHHFAVAPVPEDLRHEKQKLLAFAQCMRDEGVEVPDITAGEPDRLLSSFVNGIKHLPCDFSRLAT